MDQQTKDFLAVKGYEVDTAQESAIDGYLSNIATLHTNNDNVGSVNTSLVKNWSDLKGAVPNEVDARKMLDLVLYGRVIGEYK